MLCPVLVGLYVTGIENLGWEAAEAYTLSLLISALDDKHVDDSAISSVYMSDLHMQLIVP